MTASPPDEPPMDDPEAIECQLISITCTTSMSDWVHGDLWLCPDGLLRRSRGWQATLSNVSKYGVKEAVDPNFPRRTGTFRAAERRQIADADKRNRWLPWDQVARAKIRSGPMSHAVHLELTDGRKVSLRWFRAEGGLDLIRAAMQPTLGERID